MNDKKSRIVRIGLIASIVLNVCLVGLVVFFAAFGPHKYEPQNLPAEFNLMSEAWRLLKDNYIDRSKVDATKLSEGAVRGMVMALDDKYSAYVSPEEYKSEVNMLKGKFQGIGAVVGINKDKQIIIIAPIENSPAEEAGLKTDDIILKVDNKSTEDMSVNDVALKIRGPAGTTVKLTILREGEEEPFEVTLIRREIIDKSVTVKYFKDVAYIKLSGFTENTTTQFKAALDEIIPKNVKGIIVDVRNNTGGLLNVAVHVTSQFLSKGVVVKAVDNQGRTSIIPVIPGGMATEIPLVVLVNKGSASASEVVAGALQDYERAKLIGKQTFGKGSVQIINNLSDGSALHITIAHWLTPTSRLIDKVGLQPDLYSELEGEDLIKFAVDYLNGDFQINPSYK